jgi:dihydrofolate reductase
LKKIIISAIAKNGVIGRSDGKMPWHVKEEFQHFKDTTLGFSIIMGRKTFETLGKPLKGRLNVIITRNADYDLSFEEVKIFNSLKESLDYFENENQEKIFIIGGGEIYRQSINIADEMILSYMNFEADGDIYFPKFKNTEWEIMKKNKRTEFEIFYYTRKVNAK